MTIRLGMLTPSCNSVLEPMTSAIVANLDGVTAHFSRFRVEEISLREPSIRQFEQTPMLQAASLLADAKVDVIAWNGTAGSWLGYDNEVALCASITRETGIPATTTLLTIDQLFRVNQVARFGLVSPYTEDVQKQIIANFAARGFECVAEQRLNLTDGFVYAHTTAAQLSAMLRSVAEAKPDAGVILCTNLKGAPLVEMIEAETGMAVYDSICTTLWGCLRLVGYDTSRVTGWGQIFRSR